MLLATASSRLRQMGLKGGWRGADDDPWRLPHSLDGRVGVDAVLPAALPPALERASGSTPADVVVSGVGVLHDQLYSGVRLDSFIIECPGVPWWLPRALARPAERFTLTFVDCEFRDITISTFDPDCSRFIGCRFERMSVAGLRCSVHIS